MLDQYCRARINSVKWYITLKCIELYRVICIKLITSICCLPLPMHGPPLCLNESDFSITEVSKVYYLHKKKRFSLPPSRFEAMDKTLAHRPATSLTPSSADEIVYEPSSLQWWHCWALPSRIHAVEPEDVLRQKSRLQEIQGYPE